MALNNICEDSAVKLLNSAPQLVSHLISFFIKHMDSNPNPKVRSLAICSANYFLSYGEIQAFGPLINPFVEGLYRRAASDTDADVRKYVCQGIVKVLEANPGALQSQLKAVIEFMISCTAGEDPSVALEACEFWLALADQEEYYDYLEQYIPQYVEVFFSYFVLFIKLSS